MPDPLIINTDRGLYCPAGDFHIDAWAPVERNIVTHAHSDHARRGSKKYLTAPDNVPFMRKRLGADIAVTPLAWGEEIRFADVLITLHPAGHIRGSSQVRLERGGEIWVFTGDYKLQPDPTCARFELIRCHTLITECTFGLPLYRWRDPAITHSAINDWWRRNAAEGRNSVILAYALGKSQRVLSGLDPAIGGILLHGAVQEVVELYRASGVSLPPTLHANAENAKAHKGKALIVAPPGALNSPWARKFNPLSVGVASGWMQVRGFRRRQAADRGFVLSDHVDWPGLLDTIAATGAQRVIATHGYTGPLVRFLKERGMDAVEFATRFKGEGDDEEVPAHLPHAADGSPAAAGADGPSAAAGG
ncbi:MAG TPA: ligase-associated DNA damage response exonuclease [Phycisphaerae bacterium]|nr:ligase-associated DNA damage response exonuclease [Phycisphaerae bacterium]